MPTEPEVEQFDPQWFEQKGNHMTLITPELAEVLLERNHNNRKPKERSIIRYAADMQAGKWDPDAADVKFDVDGNLLDGQNRLLACKRAGVPFATLVRTGLRPETRRHVDLGVKRTIADVLRMEGVQWTNNVAAGVALRLRYEEAEASGRKVYSQLKLNLTPDDVLDYLREHPAHEKYAPLADTMWRLGPGVTRSVYFAFVPMAVEVNEQEALRFCDAFVNGDVGGPGAALNAYLRYLAKARAPRQQGPGVKLRNVNERHLLALARTWNAWRMNEPLERIVIRDEDLMEPLV